MKSINNINKIWQRLKYAYGDTKIMLSRKLQILWKSDLKSRDPEKLIYAISIFTNILCELILLASKHGIEANLYYSDALPKIYQQKETWQKLLKFLEKEEKLQQQKLIINNSGRNNRDPSSKSSNNKGKKESYFSPNLNQPHCHIWGESARSSEHIATFSPGSLKIFQYFTSKTFTKKTPAAQLKILQEKDSATRVFFQEPTLHKEITIKEDVSVILSALIQATTNTLSKIMQ